jgi:tubulin polyglutamylase TTLL6/13
MKAMLKTEFSLLPTLCHGYLQLGFFGKQDQQGDLFLIWMDSYVSEEFVKRLRGYQKVNHFPNSCQLGRKDLLANNLNAMQVVAPGEYAFFPRTWVLPAQYEELMARLKEGREVKEMKESRVGQSQPYYIVKPHANCQGRGISLSRWPNPSLKD